MKANKVVKQMCKDHGVSYHEASMWDGTKEVFGALKEIAMEFIDLFPAM